MNKRDLKWLIFLACFSYLNYRRLLPYDDAVCSLGRLIFMAMQPPQTKKLHVKMSGWTTKLDTDDAASPATAYDSLQKYLRLLLGHAFVDLLSRDFSGEIKHNDLYTLLNWYSLWIYTATNYMKVKYTTGLRACSARFSGNCVILFILPF